MSSDTQYTLAGDIYVRCGETHRSIPAGFYDVVDAGRAGHGFRPKSIVGDELIMVPGTVADEVFDDIEKFMDRYEEFKGFGFTHKRGYMFHGPGGSGKTSIGIMIARRFIEKLGGVVVFAPDPRSFYQGVSILRDIEPGRPSLYLLEEADRVVNNTHCLSILDGAYSIDRAVFIAMTNYKGRLPQRITNRPGRFARVAYIAAPPRQVQVEFLRRIASRSPLGASVSSELIVDSLEGLEMTLDHLREAFVSHALFGEDLGAIRTRFAEMASSTEEGDGSDSDLESKDYWEPSDDC